MYMHAYVSHVYTWYCTHGILALLEIYKSARWLANRWDVDFSHTSSSAIWPSLAHFLMWFRHTSSSPKKNTQIWNGLTLRILLKWPNLKQRRRWKRTQLTNTMPSIHIREILCSRDLRPESLVRGTCTVGSEVSGYACTLAERGNQ